MARPKTDKQSSRLTVSLDEQDYAEVCRLWKGNNRLTEILLGETSATFSPEPTRAQACAASLATG